MKYKELGNLGIALVVLLTGLLAVQGFQNLTLRAGTLDNSGSDFGFSELDVQDRERLSAQRRLVLEEARHRYGTTELFRDERDLLVLQQMIDDRAFSSSQTYELQSLGIVYGDVIASKDEFEWMIISDEYGRDPTLRYKNTSAHVNALTMLSKRIEQFEPVDVRNMFEETVAYLEAKENELD